MAVSAASLHDNQPAYLFFLMDFRTPTVPLMAGMKSSLGSSALKWNGLGVISSVPYEVDICLPGHVSDRIDAFDCLIESVVLMNVVFELVQLHQMLCSPLQCL